MSPFTFERQARTPASMLVVGAVWAALVLAYVYLDAAPWIVVALGLFTLPALYEYATNARAGLQLTNDTLSWFSGRRSATLALAEVDHMRLDTRLDFSVRATAILSTGRKIRLPFEATPPHTDFEHALKARGLAVKRFHFQLFQ